MNVIEKISENTNKQALLQVIFNSNKRLMKHLPIKYQRIPIASRSVDDSQTGYIHSVSLYKEIDCIIFLLSISGCRIREILNLRGRDIVDSQTIIIHGLKRSASRMIRVPELTPLLSRAIMYPDLHLFHHNYIYVYRECLARGIFTKHLNSKHRSVTHLLRYNKISQLRAVAENTKTVSDCIGHRTEKTTQKYLDKEKKDG